MAQYFAVPDQWAGKSLFDIRNQTGGAFRPDVLAGFLGVNERDPLTAGQTFQIDTRDPGSAEYQFLSRSFAPGLSPGERKLKEQEARETDFLGRFRNALPDIRQRLEGELGLPNLRESTRGLQEAVLDLEGTLFRLPQNVASRTRGFDVNQAQLERMQTAEAQPVQRNLIETARAAERAGGRLAATEGQFTSRFGQELMPFQSEASMISDRAAREVAMYGQDQQNELSMMLAKMQQGTQLSMAEMQRAHDLATREDEFERAKQMYTFQTNEQIRQSQALRRAGGSSGGGSGSSQGLMELWQSIGR